MTSRNLLPFVMAGCLLGLGMPAVALQDDARAITGAWTLNLEASDTPRDEDAAGGDPGGREGGRAGRGAGGRGGRGGRGGGSGRSGAFGGGRGPAGRDRNRDDMERRLEAMRAILRPSERLTITRTESMVIITTDQGITTRLATDGSKVKDESTGIERRSRWEGDRLTTDISGVGPGRITETYAVDAATGQLIVTLQLPTRRNADQDTPQTIRRVYQSQR